MLDHAERERLTNLLKDFMGAKRHDHSVKVATACVRLAQLHAPQLEDQAEIAGLLHDNAKKMPVPDQLAIARERGLPVSPEEESSPELLHGKVGALLLKRRFGIDDPEVEQAVCDHVTGRPGMGLLSKLLYVADYTSADRSFPGVEEVREIARQDLDAAVFAVASGKLRSIIERGLMIESNTVALYNEYREHAHRLLREERIDG
ncbi:bis(5'-nucleosyl)-tetraphosphatase (symmetrical) YqeK [bacterium]|nr:bis(5'-nucleosyl)-tetraphosphatase (symmetrical) YqeK [bacterium]